MDDELRLLHEQAFGRRSDGAARDAAMARLADIDAERWETITAAHESARDDAPADTPAVEPGEPGERGRVPAFGDGPHGTPRADAAPGPASPGRAESALRRFGTFVESLPRGRAILLWAGSLVVTALITLGAVSAASILGSHGVAVLAVDPDGEIPEDYLPPDADAVVFETFHGLQLAAFDGDGWGLLEGGRCLFALYPQGADAQVFIGMSGCEAGPFPAVTTLTVDENMPEDLQERFPAGTTMQFELAGDRVIVRAG